MEVRYELLANSDQSLCVFFLCSLYFFISVSAQSGSSIYQIQSGRRIRVRMDNEINSRVASANDTFTVKTSEPLKVNDSVILIAGTVIEGRYLQSYRQSKLPNR